MQGGAERQHHTQKRTEAGCVLLAPEIEELLCGLGTPPTPVLERSPQALSVAAAGVIQQ